MFCVSRVFCTLYYTYRRFIWCSGWIYMFVMGLKTFFNISKQKVGKKWEEHEWKTNQENDY